MIHFVTVPEEARRNYIEYHLTVNIQRQHTEWLQIRNPTRHLLAVRQKLSLLVRF